MDAVIDMPPPAHLQARHRSLKKRFSRRLMRKLCWLVVLNLAMLMASSSFRSSSICHDYHISFYDSWIKGFLSCSIANAGYVFFAMIGPIPRPRYLRDFIIKSIVELFTVFSTSVAIYYIAHPWEEKPKFGDLVDNYMVEITMAASVYFLALSRRVCPGFDLGLPLVFLDLTIHISTEIAADEDKMLVGGFAGLVPRIAKKNAMHSWIGILYRLTMGLYAFLIRLWRNYLEYFDECCTRARRARRKNSGGGGGDGNEGGGGGGGGENQNEGGDGNEGNGGGGGGGDGNEGGGGGGEYRGIAPILAYWQLGEDYLPSIAPGGPYEWLLGTVYDHNRESRGGGDGENRAGRDGSFRWVVPMLAQLFLPPGV